MNVLEGVAIVVLWVVMVYEGSVFAARWIYDYKRYAGASRKIGLFRNLGESNSHFRTRLTKGYKHRAKLTREFLEKSVVTK